MLGGLSRRPLGARRKKRISPRTTTVRHDAVTPVALVPRLDRGSEPESTADGCRIKSGMTARVRHDGSGPA
jgi:hypothetical protein